MCDIESQLNPSQFKRILRSFVVNVSYIGTYWYGYVSLTDGLVAVTNNQQCLTLVNKKRSFRYSATKSLQH